MQVEIDHDLCMGDRNCNKACPDMFAYDVNRMVARVIADKVPAGLEDRVRQAAAGCIPDAIIITE